MNKSLRRKVIYVCCIVGLLLPLYALGRPKSGSIAKMRSEYRISQSYLGQPDPASEGMRLATLGMRGIGSSILWLLADHYKENKQFVPFAATLKQISLLQPHFISVWQHQAHNISYNVAPIFDDYRMRYEWIKKGIDYLVVGTKYNEKKPILQYDLGHFVGHKIGKADEHLQYRAMFRKDKEFHKFFVEEGLDRFETDGLGYDQNPDNWRVGRLWFDIAVASYQRGNRIAKTPHLLYSYGPLWIMYYGEAMQEEGILDDKSRFAWDEAGRLWEAFGKTDIPWTGEGQIRLGDVSEVERLSQSLRDQFDQISSEPQKALKERLLSKLSDELKSALNLSDAELNALPEAEGRKKFELRQEARAIATPSLQDIVAECPKSKQAELLRLMNEMKGLEEKIRITNIYRSNVNFEYWEMRAKAEQMPRTVEARRALFQAEQLINAADPEGAIKSFETAFDLWDKVLRRFPRFAREEIGDMVLKAVNRYKRLLEIDLDDDFKLKWFVDYRNSINTEAIGADRNEEFEKKMEIWSKEQEKLDALEESGQLPPNEEATKEVPSPADPKTDAEPKTETPANTDPKAEQVPEPKEPDQPAEPPKAEPTPEPKDPTEPAEPPKAEPAEPLQPSDPPKSEPSEPPKTEPTAEPTEPTAEPTEPPAEPTEPPAEPTEPPAEPTEPPAEPTKEPGEPK